MENFKNTLKNKFLYFLSGTTVVSAFSIIPIKIYSDQTDTMGLVTLLCAWSTVRYMLRLQNINKEQLEQNISRAANTHSTDVACKQQLPTNLRYGLAAVRGYAGLIASFSALVFPISTSTFLIEVFGSIAVSSIYLECIIENFQLKHELTLKKQIAQNLKVNLENYDESLPPRIKIIGMLALFFVVMTATLTAIKLSDAVETPPALIPASIILSLLSVLFTNRFYNKHLDFLIFKYSEKNNATPLTSNAGPIGEDTALLQTGKNVERNKTLSRCIQLTAAVRGIIATNLAIFTYFKMLTPERTRALGGTILVLNFMEAMVEIANAFYANKQLNHESNKITQHYLP